jgi:hypothetical protein
MKIFLGIHLKAVFGRFQKNKTLSSDDISFCVRIDNHNNHQYFDIQQNFHLG